MIYMLSRRFCVLICLSLLLVSCASSPQPDTPARPIQIAIYTGPGAGDAGPPAVQRALASLDHVTTTLLTPDDFTTADLSAYDILVFPGGRGRAQGQALGEEGRANIKSYVHQGGHYIGICAGAYLATARFPDYLAIVKAYHHRPWQMGRGTVTIQLTEAGTDYFNQPATPIKVRYANGPMLAHEDGLIPNLDLPDYEVLATFTSAPPESHDLAPTLMPGQPAIIASTFGEGRIVLISPHPESSPELDWVLQTSVHNITTR
ncbi:MAG: BPL-N domain-containing protein [Phycisphaeraceae bacterium]